MTTLWELENELNCGIFSQTTQMVEGYKIEQAFRLLTNEINLSNASRITLETEISGLKTELVQVKEMYKETLDIIRKVGKDYPEIVLAKPHMFAEEEFQKV